MDRSNIGLGAILIAALAVLAAGLPGGASSAPALKVAAVETPHQTPSSGDGRHHFPQHTALDIIMDSFDADPGQIDKSQIWSANDTDWSAPAGWKPIPLNVIIATLPDPVAPALREKFDDRITAIQRAAEAGGYALDRLDLPWPAPNSEPTPGIGLGQEIDLHWKDESPPTATAPPIPSSHSSPDGKQGNPVAASALDPHRYFLAAQGKPTDANRFEADPGLLLFRDDAKRTSLLVFLIGERPTSGVHERALRSALDQVSWLCGWKDGAYPDPMQQKVFQIISCDDSSELKLLAPSFSGSVDSLDRVLANWRSSIPRPPKTLNVVSGAAAMSKESGRKTSTVVMPIDASNLQIVIQAELGWPESRIAILAEGDTSYGQRFQGQRFQKGSILWIPFPMHISDLRQAAAKKAIALPPAPNLASGNIQLPSEEIVGQSYVAVPYSPRTASSDELILSNILTTINRERVRYVVLAATDVEDRMFLAQQIRSHCRDTTIFLLGSDLMYLHSDFNNDLRGSLVLSTYPLFTMNQLWTYPFDGETGRRQFPNEQAEGVFNAMLALLNRPDLMEDYSVPFASRPTGRPALWISVVGRDGLWPVDFAEIRDSEGVLFQPKLSQLNGSLPSSPSVELLSRGLYPTSFIWLFLISSLATFVSGALVLSRTWTARNGRMARLLLPFWKISPLSLRRVIGFRPLNSHLAESSELGVQRRSFLLSLLIGIFTLYLVLGVFFELPLLVAIFGSVSTVVNWYRDTMLGDIAIGLSVLVFVVVFGCCGLGIVALAIQLARFAKENQDQRDNALKNGETGQSHKQEGREQSTPMPANRHVGRIERTLQLAALSLPNSVIFAILGLIYCFSLAFFSNNSDSSYTAPTALFLFLRASNLGSGMSPLVPILLIGIAALTLLACSLKRVAFLDEYSSSNSPLSFTSKLNSFSGVAEAGDRVREFLKLRPGDLPSARFFFIVGAGGFLWFMSMRPGHSLEGISFDYFMGFGAFAVFVAIAWSETRLILVWYVTRRLLRRLYRHPGHLMFSKFRQIASNQNRMMLTEASLSLTALESSLETVREMIQVPSADTQGDAAAIELIRQVGLLRADLRKAESELSTALSADVKGHRVAAAKARADCETAVGNLAVKIGKLLEPKWRTEQVGTVASATPASRKIYSLAELFVAARVVDFLREIFPHFRNLMTATTIAILLTLLALSSYPFSMRDALLTMAWITVLSAVSGMFYVFFTMNRDQVLSMLAGTTPGKLTWNATFVAQLMIYGLLPLLGLLGVQFPGQFGSLLSGFSKISPGR
jgi:hypothetical protein